MYKLIKKSSYLQIIKDGEMFVAWHSLFGFPKIINEEAIKLLNFFSEPKNIKDNQSKKVKDIKALRDCFFLVPADFDEREFLNKKILSYQNAISTGKNIEYLSLIISELCNFSCKYCISTSMINASYRRHNKIKAMDFETARQIIDIFLSIMETNGRNDPYINFGGGEPLLNWGTIKQVLGYCKKEYGEKFHFTFRLNTNASLITSVIAKTLKKHKVQIALSLDGLKEANDKVRISKSSDSSFDRIILAMDILSKTNFGIEGFSTTITADNFDLIDDKLVYFAEKKGLSGIRIDLDVIHMLSIPIENAVKKLITLKRLAKSKNINITGFWERPVENLNSSILEKHMAFCGGIAGRSVCINPNGEAFICGYSANRIANVIKNEMVNSQKYVDIINSRLVGQIKRCNGCMIEGQCIGGCYITEEYDILQKNNAIAYNCELYRRMTIELLKDSLKEAITAVG